VTAGSGKMGTGTSWESLAVVWRPRQAKALMASKEQNKLLFGGQEHVKTRWALSFFFDGLQRTQFTTVQGKRPREIIISGKKAKKVPWVVEYQNDGLSWIPPAWGWRTGVSAW